ncbi:MAG: hypothetical protein OEQ53_21930, partial [Saprospiraceae bacterium]|nr:hypothetical protein [Saprospiraceae bacterium]
AKNEIRKPIVVVAQDQSASIAVETDSIVLAKYRQDLQSVVREFENDYDVVQYSFGESIRDRLDFSYADRSSNLSSILEYVSDLYGDQNLGAVIYSTDGIYNEGKDPLYANVAFSAPVYSIAMGDTTPDKDLYIRQIFHNDIAYLGDQVAVQVDVSAFNCANRNSTVQIYRIGEGGSELAGSQSFRIDQEEYFRTFELSVPQDRIGLQRFRIALVGVDEEKTLTNNRKDFFIDVIDARQEILILAAHPHPDISALRATLEKNKNYEVTVELASELDRPVRDFDFLIMHQVPARGGPSAALLRQIRDSNVPRLIIVGERTNLSALNQIQSLVNILPKGGSANEVQGLMNSSFSLFRLDDELKQKIREFVPIDAPFADYQLNPAAQVLLWQRIGKVPTEFPLWVFGEESGVKTAILCGEGLWRWKLYDYLQHEQNEISDGLIAKSIQYLSLKEDKRRFRVYQNENLLSENLDALFDAELYNESYELINDSEVTLTIRNSNAEAFNFAFSKKSSAYSLNAGKFPVDDYTWSASTEYEGERYSTTGQFSVQAIEKESFATVANHNLLRQLSQAHYGSTIFPDQIDQLPELIGENPSLKPVSYRIFRSRNAIHLKWIFFILMALLVTEWGLRRYVGTY